MELRKLLRQKRLLLLYALCPLLHALCVLSDKQGGCLGGNKEIAKEVVESKLRVKNGELRIKK
jgi:hypothetical protein